MNLFCSSFSALRMLKLIFFLRLSNFITKAVTSSPTERTLSGQIGSGRKWGGKIRPGVKFEFLGRDSCTIRPGH